MSGIVAGVAGLTSSLSAALNIAKTMIGVRDEKILMEKTIDLQRVIIAAQLESMSIHATNAALVDCRDKLKKKIVEMENFAADFERYEMKDISSLGSIAYVLKKEMAGTEPPHAICAACAGKRVKSILQPTTRLELRYRIFQCHACKAELSVSSAKLAGG